MQLTKDDHHLQLYLERVFSKMAAIFLSQNPVLFFHVTRTDIPYFDLSPKFAIRSNGRYIRDL